MLQPAKWLGLSLVLHLIVFVCTFLWTSNRVVSAPEVIMVAVDSIVSEDKSQSKTVKDSTIAGSRTAGHDRLPDTAKPPPMEPLPQTAIATHELSTDKEILKKNKEATAVVASQPAIEAPRSIPATPAKTPVRFSVPVSEVPIPPEVARQRYLKEHFAYIRDLISSQLVYPPMARKMSWSGKVLISFVILEDGTVQNIRVSETSGFPILDKSAAETVRSAAPFPKPPVRSEIVLPVNFKLSQ